MREVGGEQRLLGVSNVVGEVRGKGIGRIVVTVEASSDEFGLRGRCGGFPLNLREDGGVNHS